MVRKKNIKQEKIPFKDLPPPTQEVINEKIRNAMGMPALSDKEKAVIDYYLNSITNSHLISKEMIDYFIETLSSKIAAKIDINKEENLNKFALNSIPAWFTPSTSSSTNSDYSTIKVPIAPEPSNTIPDILALEIQRLTGTMNLLGSRITQLENEVKRNKSKRKQS